MILVTLGTHEMPFDRLLKAIEQAKADLNLEEEIIVQSGNTKYNSDVMKMIPFVSYEEMNKLYDDARLIISHGGTGSIITGLKKDKRVIAAARLKKYGEHNDDHQLEIIKIFTESGYILEWKEESSLSEVIEEASEFEPKHFESKKEQLLTLLQNFIEAN
ncbi:PssE/Cps14G family polysaccharide biosynthesis glycosyltransferase [Aquibacillus rhizosphaerae]|uniref:PssE/Cps14G family polysaccharide biosynthesis glycosyltransferase n=1 Tax=Aquibacillus rhizosphaerae TaxID=3051431 RepID=A0ABT7KZJ4_9BACI|nr:PssE/Cps14G family polysaccharide biosynthesis glycosyltransferase [Aquibacillus sp. LR5S19]MDL4838890.1 PssE/Cps14G family polysaccharide biosynthesis glycosyltransferase [Aquibacillus sp. LR5S19]